MSTAVWVSLLVVVGGATPAGACSCADDSEDVRFEAAELVFTGRVIDVRPTDDQELVSVRFAVEDVLKGEVAEEQALLSPSGTGAACGVRWGAGTYLVFATVLSEESVYYGFGGEVFTSLCSGNRDVTQGPLPAAELRSPIPGRAGPTGVRDVPSAWLIAGIVLGSGALAGGVALLLTRRRSPGPPPVSGAGAGGRPRS